MALIVEDGTGKPDAESYHDQTFFENFCLSWGLPITTPLDVPKFEAAARRGTLIFDQLYGYRFPGTPVNSAQALVFPMTGLMDRRNFVLPNLPIQIIQAACVMVRSEYVTPLGQFPTVVPGKSKKKRVEVFEAVEVEYAETSDSLGYIDSMRPILSLVESILSPILSIPSSGSKMYVGGAVRG